MARTATRRQRIERGQYIIDTLAFPSHHHALHIAMYPIPSMSIHAVRTCLQTWLSSRVAMLVNYLN